MDEVKNGETIKSSRVMKSHNLLSNHLSSDDIIERLRCAMIDELSELRCELDALKKGGWKIAIGPFVQTKLSTDADRERIHHCIDERTNHKIKQLEAPFTIPVKYDVKSPDSIQNSCSPKTFEAEDVRLWKPAYIRSLQPFVYRKLPSPNNMITFSWEFLHRIFRGAMEHSPGLWYIPLNAGRALITGRTFYAIDATTEPYMPRSPCDHGAKITGFYNNNPPDDGGEISYTDVPLFITGSAWVQNCKANEYIYFGNYSQTRWSDKVSYGEFHDLIPDHIKDFWAAQFADPSRPSWVSRELMKHFFPMPEYDGAMPSATSKPSVGTDEYETQQRIMQKDMEYYLEDLSHWESNAKKRVGLLKKEDIRRAFENADADESPSLRLWWEYLECKSWDRAFYETLVREQNKMITTG
ncbi:hypothetical protein, variant 3 [Verruconis gallopava]|uniref:DUF6697 domain-containing protein n=1 Tax=Verruconis gallopava TaxID=253628 RepID=A0A0D1XSU9_9PEZI|nr:uncharacterized protein PV09_03015 [Verruconis gallopava]XP_016215676.1 hypothetical protein, variant 1 [Verruconis gallopava]XP_016215677.1 hypothetical protein, variant 2 [Verruconis gallopava]XP_016215678.1 hypothetical protein, variant 3 [Verruconis gallopava]KIW05806.1 hypothetical protein PV09_03015 [Verruconis gallopava]KIW05807.1 hypothetical protein, variant 1 [Verruconis gallopava]KIW05808.1 hypothetical protein, variant 2 [Verruconis gallopava]KIW05809.1 hypothetical protein, v